MCIIIVVSCHTLNSTIYCTTLYKINMWQLTTKITLHGLTYYTFGKSLSLHFDVTLHIMTSADLPHQLKSLQPFPHFIYQNKSPFYNTRIQYGKTPYMNLDYYYS